jgi:hypothetical protein
MNNYCIWIISPNGDNRSLAYVEFAESLHYSFKSIGYDVPIVRDQSEIRGRPIILGCNLLREFKCINIPKESILFNLEQVSENSIWFTEDYINLLKSFTVWDYSKLNITKLKQFGIDNVKLCQVGYASQLTRLNNNCNNDIDVLLYGKKCSRRIDMYEKLKALKLNVVYLNSIYGKQRDAFIERSKIIINIHCYDAKIFEIIRISYLLSNKKFVISESGNDKDLENPFLNSLVFTSYNNIPKKCLYYLNKDNESERALIALNGFKFFTQKEQAYYLGLIL